MNRISLAITGVQVIESYLLDRYRGVGPDLLPPTPEARARAALVARIHDLYIAPVQGAGVRGSGRGGRPACACPCKGERSGAVVATPLVSLLLTARGALQECWAAAKGGSPPRKKSAGAAHLETPCVRVPRTAPYLRPPCRRHVPQDGRAGAAGAAAADCVPAGRAGGGGGGALRGGCALPRWQPDPNIPLWSFLSFACTLLSVLHAGRACAAWATRSPERAVAAQAVSDSVCPMRSATRRRAGDQLWRLWWVGEVASVQPEQLGIMLTWQGWQPKCPSWPLPATPAPLGPGTG